MSPSDADDDRPAEAGAARDDEHAHDVPTGPTGTAEPVPADPDHPDDPDDLAAREAAAWQAIVAHYGERPTLEESAAPPEQPRPRDPAGRAGPSRPDLDDDLPARGGVAESDDADPEDHFVPPPPPPVPSATPPRLLAWLGLFGVPMLTLVALVAGIALPQWLSVVLMAWFVGGFVFLVASMRPGPRDDHDDGAVL